jgi:hypothetical protein
MMRKRVRIDHSFTRFYFRGRVRLSDDETPLLSNRAHADSLQLEQLFALLEQVPWQLGIHIVEE